MAYTQSHNGTMKVEALSILNLIVLSCAIFISSCISCAILFRIVCLCVNFFSRCLLRHAFLRHCKDEITIFFCFVFVWILQWLWVSFIIISWFQCHSIVHSPFHCVWFTLCVRFQPEMSRETFFFCMNSLFFHLNWF